MSGHTPGPWTTVKPGHGHETEYLCVQIGEDALYTTLELLPEDARLIAAAPDMYAALVLLLHNAPLPKTGTEKRAFKNAALVIAKAEGHQA